MKGLKHYLANAPACRQAGEGAARTLSMFGLPREIVVFDTEYTSWEGAKERGWGNPGEHKEVVQIGALTLDTDTLAETSSLLLLVKPVKNPLLSDYFTKLTGISQEEVDRDGLSYEAALSRFGRWGRGLPLFCWGDDVEVMEGNAKLLGIPFPFPADGESDIKNVFKARGIPAEHYYSSTIPRAFGEEPPPHAHDALNDARSIAQGLRALARVSPQ